jgi:hypothetical protein
MQGTASATLGYNGLKHLESVTSAGVEPEASTKWWCGGEQLRYGRLEFTVADAKDHYLAPLVIAGREWHAVAGEAHGSCRAGGITANESSQLVAGLHQTPPKGRANMARTDDNDAQCHHPGQSTSLGHVRHLIVGRTRIAAPLDAGILPALEFFDIVIIDGVADHVEVVESLGLVLRPRALGSL